MYAIRPYTHYTACRCLVWDCNITGYIGPRVSLTSHLNIRSGSMVKTRLFTHRILTRRNTCSISKKYTLIVRFSPVHEVYTLNQVIQIKKITFPVTLVHLLMHYICPYWTRNYLKIHFSTLFSSSIIHCSLLIHNIFPHVSLSTEVAERLTRTAQVHEVVGVGSNPGKR